MAKKNNFSVVSIISNLTKSEAMNLKAELVNRAGVVVPKGKYFASTGDGSNVAKAIKVYEAKRITKK